jgi:hypothetical protein
MKRPSPLNPICRKSFIIVLLVLCLATSGRLYADSVQMNIPPGDYGAQIASGSLEDPSGATHSRQEVKDKVVVAIFSAPNMSQGGRQEKWSDLLATQSDTKVSDKVSLYLVEDMTQAGMFKGMALDSMKKQFTPDSRPFLILDQTGNVFKQFGVPKNKTAILIYDKHSKLRDVEINLDDQEMTIHRIKAITKRLLDE